MEAKNLGLTLFDILSYLLPGYILLLGFSLIEATFLHTTFFSLSVLGGNWVFLSLIAYFLGHICYSIASYSRTFFYLLFKKSNDNYDKDKLLRFIKKLKLWVYKITFGNQENGLSEPLYKTVKETILDTFHLNSEEIGRVPTMERYLLADSYVIASGGENERASLLVREGFYKSSTVAFGAITLIFLISLFHGGMVIQIEVGNFQQLGNNFSLCMTILLGIMTVIFGNRYKFFNRMKICNTYILFLAYKERNTTRK